LERVMAKYFQRFEMVQGLMFWVLG
jgi:hypothetical protein